uniref:hypothetical protein n=1 Tax=Yoonia sp. TaxID=2212373 RepID=UPI004047B7F6
MKLALKRWTENAVELIAVCDAETGEVLNGQISCTIESMPDGTVVTAGFNLESLPYYDQQESDPKG